MREPLPIDAHVPAIAAAVAERRRAVIVADPGAGKSTRVPPALLGIGAGAWILLQPRRIAARSLAARIAAETGSRLGEGVGYAVRHERVGGARTRLWVMTEGLLTRRLLDDPLLEGVAGVILDEFHERSIHADLALAWCAQLGRELRPDLAVVVMSATLDPDPIAAFLGGAAVLRIAAPRHPVQIADGPAGDLRSLPERVRTAVEREAARPDAGDILVFLPGAGEIAACAAALAGATEREVLPLHGGLPPAAQDAVLQAGTRPRVILATNVAETSLTIPGVRTVIDSGLQRVERFDPERDIDELVLEPCSRAAAAQRAGRAGRTAPGRCVRLWSPLVQARMRDTLEPEVRRIDLAPAVLALKQLHGADVAAFPWFEAPDAPRLAAAERLLDLLGALERRGGALSALGRRLARVPAHPRVARLLIAGADAGKPQLAARLAAALAGRDLRRPPRRGQPPPDPAAHDLADRLELLAGRDTGDPEVDGRAVQEARRLVPDLLRLIGVEREGAPEPASDRELARLCLAAWPDRLCVRAAPDSDRAMMVGGIAVELEGSALCARRGRAAPRLFLALAVQGLSAPGRATVCVRLACAVDEEDLDAVHPGRRQRRDRVQWDAGRQRVETLAGWWWDDLLLAATPGAAADPEAVAACLAEHLVPEAEALVRQDPEAARLLERWRWLAAQAPDLAPPLPDLAALVRQACQGRRSRAEVAALPWHAWLVGVLGHQGLQALEAHAPERVAVPSGARVRLDYGDPARPPVLAVRIQELFGSRETPTVAAGRVRVLLHLLAPNGRPEQVTDDLAGFWQRTYPQVRKDLRGRYPKHAWPEDPLAARPPAPGRPR